MVVNITNDFDVLKSELISIEVSVLPWLPMLIFSSSCLVLGVFDAPEMV